ncbi:MAG: class I SAM-dependent DNA methyltransferase, partial [Comamonas sp.]|nr:class I SAM-dependent DNA methyltransferase [Comamonas sp.]
LFKAMQEPHGIYGNDDIAWFNGGLFKQVQVPQLTVSDLSVLHAAAADMDWRAIDPTIFGTLFERGLGSKRAALGAHYTDTGTIAKLIDPLVRQPLQREWAAARTQIEKAKTTKAKEKHYQTFLLRLSNFRVLDPACGSGNFLYLALKALRDVEKQAQIEAQELSLPAELNLQTGPHNILGIEINEFAAELARVTVWIGDIQWCRQNGWPHSLNPILKPLDGIEHRDALVNADGSEAVWPQADVVVGNPPFIGDKKMRGELGLKYTTTLRKAFEGRVPGGADLVCYWFEKARAQIEAGRLHAAGLVSTNSIRGGANRKVLERICDTTRIFLAWSDEPWINDGAAVRVSMVGFGEWKAASLDGVAVHSIHADLTTGVNVTMAWKLPENLDKSFQGVTPRAEIQKKRRLELGLPSASFNLEGGDARRILREPMTVNSEPISAVVRPYWIADDITTRPLDRFIINFGVREKLAASFFEQPFSALENVRLNREKMDDAQDYPWWLLWRPRPAMFEALNGLLRYISIPRVSKHFLCVWTNPNIVPGDALVVIARDDDTTFGILQSRIHEVWALRRGTSLGVGNDPRYTHTTCFETFPFPDGMSPNVPSVEYENIPDAKAIAAAAQALVRARNYYLNPPEWTDWIITPEEEKAGFPKRPVAKPGHEAELKKRTLTNLYNARPAWLALAHEALDKAVAAAYGWQDYTPAMPDEDILRRLLALNLARSSNGS